MRALIQRVLSASVSVDGEKISEISKGALIFLGVKVGDKKEDLDYLVKKISGLRIFDDENSVMNLSILDLDLEILVVSQFTLYADTRKGNRPSYVRSEKRENAYNTYMEFIKSLRNLGIKVSEGSFGADMKVSLVNDGPVTIIIDSEKIY